MNDFKSSPSVDSRCGTVIEGRSEQIERAWFVPYEPLRIGGHGQTLAGNYWKRHPLLIPFEAQAVEVDREDGSRVLCHCHWQVNEVRAERLTVLLVHGLEGSSDSGYMRRITAQAWEAGCNVIRMNMRNCGGTEDWTPTLYHSGRSADVAAVMNHFVAEHGLRRVALAGYSMGGNLVLKLAGELKEMAPEWLIGVVGVSPATDLALSADALHEPMNRVYEWHFLRNLMRRFRRKAELYPAIYANQKVGRVRTIRDFDDRITARFSGFRNADEYYFRASSARVVDQIAIPTLVIHALNDPFIRMSGETRVAIDANPAIEFIETLKGGHCAFLSRDLRKGGVETLRSSRHWAEATLLRFLLAVDQKGREVRHGS